MDYSDFDRWEFVYDEVLHWTWRRFAADGHLRMPSRATFTTMEDCISDAKLYGFADYEAVDERDVERVEVPIGYGLVSAIPSADSHRT